MQKFLFGFIGLVVGAALTVAVTAWIKDTDPAMPEMEMSETDGAENMGAMHTHPMRPVTTDQPVPSLTHLVFPDAMDGYNVQILPRNFRFTPAAINRAVEDNEGHAHIYVNGTKIGRVYSEWYHLPAALFQAGANQVTVTLNANDHSEWAIDDAPISSSVTVIRPDETQ